MQIKAQKLKIAARYQTGFDKILLTPWGTVTMTLDVIPYYFPKNRT